MVYYLFNYFFVYLTTLSLGIDSVYSMLYTNFTVTEPRQQVFGYPASYSRGPWFKSRPGYRLS